MSTQSHLLLELQDAHPVSISDDGKLLAAGSARLMRFYDLTTGELIHQWKPLTHTSRAAFSPIGASMAISDTDGTIQLRTLDDEVLWTNKAKVDREGSTLVWSPDGKRIFSDGRLGFIFVLDAETGAEILATPSPKTRGFARTDDGHLFTAQTLIQEIAVPLFRKLHSSDLSPANEAITLDSSKNRVDWGVSRNSQWIWCVSHEGDRDLLEIFDSNLTLVAQRSFDRLSTSRIEFSPLGTEICSHGFGPEARRLTFPGLEPIESFPMRAPGDIRYSFDGRILVIGGWGGARVLTL